MLFDLMVSLGERFDSDQILPLDAEILHVFGSGDLDHSLLLRIERFLKRRSSDMGGESPEESARKTQRLATEIMDAHFHVIGKWGVTTPGDEGGFTTVDQCMRIHEFVILQRTEIVVARAIGLIAIHAKVNGWDDAMWHPVKNDTTTRCFPDLMMLAAHIWRAEGAWEEDEDDQMGECELTKACAVCES